MEPDSPSASRAAASAQSSPQQELVSPEAAPAGDPDWVHLSGSLDLRGRFHGLWNYHNSTVRNEFAFEFDVISGQHRGYFRLQRTEKSQSKVSEWVKLTSAPDDVQSVSGHGSNRFGDFRMHGTWQPETGQFTGFKEYVRLKLPAASTPVARREESSKRHREPNRKYESEEEALAAAAAASASSSLGLRARTTSRSMAWLTDDEEDKPPPVPAAVYFDYAAQEAAAPHLSIPRTGTERQQRVRKRLRDMIISLPRRNFFDGGMEDTTTTTTTTLGPPESHPLAAFVKPVPVVVVVKPKPHPKIPAVARSLKKSGGGSSLVGQASAGGALPWSAGGSGGAAGGGGGGGFASTSGTSSTNSAHMLSSSKGASSAVNDARWGVLLNRIRAASTAIRPAVSRVNFEEIVEAAIEPDGSVYQGRLLNGARHGPGVVVYANGYTYSGEFRKGQEHGEGELRDEQGALVYRGGFEAGSISGRGTFYYSDGYVYGGDVRESVRHGKGSMWAPDGSVYEGDYVFGLRTGHGVYLSALGSYKGEWLDDLRHGRGVMKLRDGTRLEGTFSRGHPEGRCLVVFPDGSRYEGNFKDGLKDSRGTYTFANGCVYEGRFRLDGIAGTGTLKLKSGVSLELPSKDGDASKHEWMTPVDLSAHQELRLVHLKAGFSAEGL